MPELIKFQQNSFWKKNKFWRLLSLLKPLIKRTNQKFSFLLIRLFYKISIFNFC